MLRRIRLVTIAATGALSFVLMMQAVAIAQVRIKNTPFDPDTWILRQRPPSTTDIEDGIVEYPGWNRWIYKGGLFQQLTNKSWAEYQNGKHVYSFKETRRDRNYIYLYDPSRRLEVALGSNEFSIKLPGENWKKFRDGCGIYMTSTFRTRGSTFRFKGNDVTETRPDGTTSHFRVSGYRSDVVDLYDRQRNMYVRLEYNRALYRTANGREWREWPGSNGRWVE